MTHAPVAVVLAAGMGSRMREVAVGTELTGAQRAAATLGLKGMIPDSRGRPFLDHILSAIADAGITDVCVVVGAARDEIAAHYRRLPPRRLQLTFVTQQSPTGTADAVLCAASCAGDRDIVVLNADNLYPSAAIAALVQLGEPGLVAFDRQVLIHESNIDAARIAAFAILSIDEDDLLRSIIEKPDVATLGAAGSEWISMNLWRFDATIYEACRDVAQSSRGERELPLAVALALSRHARFRAVRMAAGVLDLSRANDILGVAARLGGQEARP